MRLHRHLFSTFIAFFFAITATRSGSAANWRTTLKAALGPRHTTRLRCLVRGRRFPRWGNLRSLEPFSSEWGLDRGTPIDRYFGDRFFEENRSLITGKALEIQNPVYTGRYGVGVRQADSIDIDAKFGPKIVCDLAKADEVIPDNTYDCFLLPYTLIVVKGLEPALRNAMRVVKPGGWILATTSVLTPVLAEYPEYWRMTEEGWKDVLARVWPGSEPEVRTHGNCVTAVASILGLAQEELEHEELHRNDPRFPVLISIKCRKPIQAA
jgi:hypothetical protein